MAQLETVTYTAPAEWASYLINGDASGLEDNDIAECDAWLEDIMAPGMYGPVDCEDMGFCQSCDAVRQFVGDVCEYTFMRQEA